MKSILVFTVLSIISTSVVAKAAAPKVTCSMSIKTYKNVISASSDPRSAELVSLKDVATFDLTEKETTVSSDGFDFKAKLTQGIWGGTCSKEECSLIGKITKGESQFSIAMPLRATPNQGYGVYPMHLTVGKQAVRVSCMLDLR